MGDLKRVYRLAVAFVVLVASLATVTAAQADLQPSERISADAFSGETDSVDAASVEAGSVEAGSADRASLDDEAEMATLYNAVTVRSLAADDPTADARCGDASKTAVPDGEPITVTMPPAAPFTVGQIPASAWETSPVNDPTWSMHFWSLVYLRPLARRAAQDGQHESLQAMVDQLVAFHQQNPDAGASQHGWDEGTTMHRLGTENCLYSLTGSAALLPGMNADANVLLGPRYYGPPTHKVHNHGLMANLQLVRAGELVEPTWKDTAIKRMTSEAPLAFSKLGITFEQASGYQLFNTKLWDQALTVLASSPGTETAVRNLRVTVAKAYNMIAWMTEPDGKIVQVGDSEEVAGLVRRLKGQWLREDETGWFIGRWAWGPSTLPYYTLRYGPYRKAHGHEDHAGGVTWSDKGVRILVGPGKYDYNGATAFNAYQTRASGSNVAVPDGGTVVRAKANLTSTIRTAKHVLAESDKAYGKLHKRKVVVERDAHRMAVADSFTDFKVWRQSWHLDPAWKLVSGKAGGVKLVFRHPSGRVLTITTNGRVSAIQRGVGANHGTHGWHFPRFGVAVPAYEITIRNHGAACTTTFQIR